jgi:hypothetical protein
MDTIVVVDVHLLSKNALSAFTRALEGDFLHVPVMGRPSDGGTEIIRLKLEGSTLPLLDRLNGLVDERHEAGENEGELKLQGLVVEVVGIVPKESTDRELAGVAV